MEERKNKENSWGGTANKILAIFIIVAGAHIVIIMLFGWFNVWKLSRGDGQAEKKDKIQEKNYSEDEHVEFPDPVENEKLLTKPVDVVKEENPPLERKSSKKEDILPLLEEIIQPPIPPNETKRVGGKIKAEKESFDTYTVIEGDNLSKIAQKTGVSVEELRNANNIEDDFIKIGQILLISTKSKNSGVSLAGSSVMPEAKHIELHIQDSQITQGGYEVYIVKKNDTLSKIARLSNTTVDELEKINSITDPAKLKEGMELKVPRK